MLPLIPMAMLEKLTKALTSVGFVGVVVSYSDPATCFGAVSLNLAAAAVGEGWRHLRDLNRKIRIGREEPNHDLQMALARAVGNALREAADGKPLKIFKKSAHWNELHQTDRNAVDDFFQQLSSAMDGVQADALQLGRDRNVMSEMSAPSFKNDGSAVVVTLIAVGRTSSTGRDRFVWSAPA